MTKRQTAAVPPAAQKKRPKTKFKPLISDERLLEMHAAMLRVRGFAEELRRARSVREDAKSVPLAEASFAALLAGLTGKETIVAPPALWQAAVVRGVDTHDLLTSLHRAPSSERERSWRLLAERGLLVCDGSAAQIVAVAAGVALAASRQDTNKRSQRAVVALVQSASAVDLAETSRFVAGLDLPLLLVSIGRKAGDRSSGHRGAAHGTVPHLPQILVDGTDAVATYRVAQEALTRARTGLGGVLIQAVLEGMAGVDSIEVLEQVLLRRHLFSTDKEKPIIFNSK